MTDIETLGILEEIQVLVSDKLQVVSYKWLSRNYLISSDAAKKLLQEFAEKHESGFEVVYTLSGWLKNNSSAYHINLVPGTKLADAKQEFDGNCSVQVYSVQACIPKDPASLWNTEYVQAEELFLQPSNIDNCLRDNRFCGISNSFIKRNAEGTPTSTTFPPSKISTVSVSSKGNSVNNTSSVPQLQPKKEPQTTPKIALQSPNIKTDVKSEINATEKAPNKKKGQSDKSSTGTSGGSLANMWGRASSKSKPISPPAETNNLQPKLPASAEAQILAREVVEGGISDDDDGENANFKRVSSNEGSRKRKAVFYYSDEDDFMEDAISLASPEPAKEKPSPNIQPCTKSMDTKKDKVINNEAKSKIKEEKIIDNVFEQPLKKNSLILKGENTASFSETIQILAPVNVDKKDKIVNKAPNSPKRKKVMKTRIDERGREVTEVVWEGEETGAKNTETNMTKKVEANIAKKADSSAVTNTVNRAAAATKKSPAVGITAASNTSGRAGNKKGATSKDPKQGNIMSFFKKV